MFKKVFDLFEPTEAQFQPKALSRIKYASLLSFLMVPALGAHHLIKDREGMQTIAIGLLVLSIILLVPYTIALGSRLFNRAWTPDKYLDESEISRKRDSATFAFIYMKIAAMIVLTVWLLWAGFKLPVPEIMKTSGFSLYVLSVYISTAFCLQAYRVATITTPVDMDEGPVTKVPADRKVVVIALIVISISVILGFIFGYYSSH